MKNLLLEKKVPVIWVLVIVLVSFLGMTSFVMMQKTKNIQHAGGGTALIPEQECAVNMSQVRGNKSPYVKPLLLTDVVIQDRSMSSLKAEIVSHLNSKMASKTLEVGSVYVRKLDNGAHISVNENELFNPASLMKIAYLITYLEEEDEKPGKLKQKLYFDKHYTQGNNQNIVDFTLKENSYYTVAELLYAMTVYSDNDATTVLMQNLNNTAFTKLFSDLELPPPPRQGEYFISVEDYAKFFRVLYSSTYLSSESSDYAVRLLLKSSFKEGICSKLNPNIQVAHKFGERILNNVAQLHEFGIVYYNDSPYLIGVMSKGTNLTPLKQTVAEISEIVFRYMESRS